MLKPLEANFSAMAIAISEDAPKINAVGML
jgi:hypothetical protein